MKPMKLAPWFYTVVILAGCHDERSTTPIRPGTGKTSPAVARARPPELPRLARPALPDAQRIVDLFYSANVGAEAEPCG